MVCYLFVYLRYYSDNLLLRSVMGRKKAKRLKVKTGTKNRVKEMKKKYGDALTLIQDIDRKDGSLKLYRPDHNRMVFWMALAGLTEPEMASVIGVAEVTLGVWKKTRPDFLAAMQAGNKEAVATAAHSLYKVGNGFKLTEEKIVPNRVKEYNPDTGRVVKEYTEILRVPVERYYPPNVNALLRFLAAKHPEVWGDRSEVVHTSTVNHSIDTTKLSAKKLKMLKEIAKSTMKSEKKRNKKEQKEE